MTYAKLGLALVEAVDEAAYCIYEECLASDPLGEHTEIQNIGQEAYYLLTLPIWGDIEVRQEPDDFVTVSYEVPNNRKALDICERETTYGFLCHIEPGDGHFEVHVATKAWVDRYYSNGGTWGYHRYHPDVDGWFPG